jgi:hypothetical protein
VISPGDEGGPLTKRRDAQRAPLNAGTLTTVEFHRQRGEHLVVRIGEINRHSGPFSPWIRLFGPDGTDLRGRGFGTLAGEGNFRFGQPAAGRLPWWSATATLPAVGTGTYRLSLAKTGSRLVISAGDEGGPLI